MVINGLVFFIAGLLAASPYVAHWAFLNQLLGFSTGPVIEGHYRLVLLGLGAGGVLMSAYNLYIGRRNGIPFIIIGAICLVTGYFHNDEKLQIIPVGNLLMGGAEFLAFVTSAMLILCGLVQEFLLGSD
ncbi:MAG: hypothetical protein HYR55_14665 [Acidobacteria bacterium]|nr:hypothetical protein [Acidobacteriota bacterium]MBI3657974.1 hypothetical protein [Acidobacteriota bacterium]